MIIENKSDKDLRLNLIAKTNTEDQPETAIVKNEIGFYGWFDIKDGYAFGLDGLRDYAIWELW